jgi:hypothetical protein
MNADKIAANLIAAYENLTILEALGMDTTRQLRIIARMEALATSTDI